MTPRFPKVCLRCGALGHYSEDCTRLPDGIGMSSYERAMVAAVRRDRNSIIYAACAIIMALCIAGWLQ